MRLAPDRRYAGPPYTVLLLAGYLAGGNYDLICCGDETLDNSSALVGPLVAELLDLPQVTSVCRMLEWTGRTVLAERNLDRGHRELVEMELPGLMTFTADAAEPHYVSRHRLQQARRKGIPTEYLDCKSAQAKLPPWVDAEKKVPPRARVKRKFTPDANLPAAERVKMIMAGGMEPQKASRNSSILEGDPDYLSEQLFRFLRHHEFI
jgi:electron transfer flavoprotein alpha/beta subunit